MWFTRMRPRGTYLHWPLLTTAYADLFYLARMIHIIVMCTTPYNGPLSTSEGTPIGSNSFSNEFTTIIHHISNSFLNSIPQFTISDTPASFTLREVSPRKHLVGKHSNPKPLRIGINYPVKFDHRHQNLCLRECCLLFLQKMAFVGVAKDEAASCSPFYD